jgi:hypothetical protein
VCCLVSFKELLGGDHHVTPRAGEGWNHWVMMLSVLNQGLDGWKGLLAP